MNQCWGEYFCQSIQIVGTIPVPKIAVFSALVRVTPRQPSLRKNIEENNTPWNLSMPVKGNMFRYPSLVKTAVVSLEKTPQSKDPPPKGKPPSERPPNSQRRVLSIAATSIYRQHRRGQRRSFLSKDKEKNHPCNLNPLIRFHPKITKKIRDLYDKVAPKR